MVVVVRLGGGRGRGGEGEVSAGLSRDVIWSYGDVVLDRSIHRPQRAAWPGGWSHALEVPAAWRYRWVLRRMGAGEGCLLQLMNPKRTPLDTPRVL